MSRRVFPGLLIVSALVVCLPAVAIEPDGRVAFRYAWADAKDGEAPRLLLSMTAMTSLADVRLVAKVPPGIGLSLLGGAGQELWSDGGFSIGQVVAGRSFVVEFEVAKPPRGGGVIGFALEATSDGRAVTEGVGVPVGVPGTEPTLRNGAAEVPSATPDAKP